MTRLHGLYPEIPMADYLAIDALGSSRLEHLAISPFYYKHMLTRPPVDTEATRRGSEFHLALLEPHLFDKIYWPEPDPKSIRPDAVVPRATKEYKAAVAAIEQNGLIVLKQDECDRIDGMVASVNAHPVSKAILAAAPEREMTAVWEREARECRGRIDALGDHAMVDIKTTRDLKRFNPYGITARGYHRQAAWYHDGLRRLGRDILAAYLIAVESSAPYDVGVFKLGTELLQVGLDECRALVWKLDQCERDQVWPGQFPDVVEATLTDAAALDLSGVTVAEE